MKVVRKNLDNGEVKVVDYPRHDTEPVYGLTGNVEFYLIERDTYPTEDARLYFIKELIECTEEQDEQLPHFKKAVIHYEVIRKPDWIIIDELNKSLGNYLDEHYPIWKRIKHTRELMEIGSGDIDSEQADRLIYLNIWREWENTCRTERDEKERLLVEQGVTPEIDTWSYKPN